VPEIRAMDAANTKNGQGERFRAHKKGKAARPKLEPKPWAKTRGLPGGIPPHSSLSPGPGPAVS